MRNLSWLPIAFIATVISVGQSYGEIEAPGLKLGGFASLREGQIVKGEPETVVGRDAKSDHVWVQELDAGLSLETKFNRATGNIAVEVAVTNDNSAYAEDAGQSRRLNFYPYIHRADLLFNIFDGENASLELDLGYFPYKYNSSVRNLGEYLFRSGTYPQYLNNDIDFPLARLMGLRFGGTLRKSLKFDILVTTNTEWSAIGDVNLSGLLSWQPFPLFEIGLGGCWNSIISVDLDKTTPLATGTRYLATDPHTGDTAIYNYTFAGQKAMGRLTLDIKKVLPWADVFGKEDLKLYSEAAILGLIDYPGSIDGYKGSDSLWHSYTQYDDILQRIPIMVGFNWPTHPLMSYTAVPALMAFGLCNNGKIDLSNFYNPSTLVAAGTGVLSGIGFWLLEKKFHVKTGLDVLSIEVEYFGNPYPNNTNATRFDNEPVPLSSFKDEKNSVYMDLHGDDWKWSVYTKKTFANNFYIMGQFARDHIRWFRQDYTKMDGKEALRDNDDWYYTFKLGYSF